MIDLKEFVPIPEWEDKYLINPKGQVYSIHSKKLKILAKDLGYPVVNLYRGRKLYRKKIHRLMVAAYRGTEYLNSNQCVDHIDGNIENCDINNLRVVSLLQNQRNPNRKPHPKNTSGVTGVYWNKNEQKWKVEIFDKGKLHFFGYHSDKNKAIELAKFHIERKRKEAFNE